MKCYYTIDPKTGKRVFIPMCWGSIDRAGPDYCNCPEPLTEHRFEKDRFNKVVKEKNDTIEALLAEINRCRKMLKLPEIKYKK